MIKKSGVLFYSTTAEEPYWSEEGDQENDIRYEGDLDEEGPSGVGKCFTLMVIPMREMS